MLVKGDRVPAQFTWTLLLQLAILLKQNVVIIGFTKQNDLVITFVD